MLIQENSGSRLPQGLGAVGREDLQGPSVARDGHSRAYRDVLVACP